jgi:hypothetical protein
MHYRERAGTRAIARQAYHYGRQDPHLYAMHRSEGMPRNGVRTVASSWLALTLGGPRFLRTPAQRGQWVRSVARRAGRVVGSVRYRTLYL